MDDTNPFGDVDQQATCSQKDALHPAYVDINNPGVFVENHSKKYLFDFGIIDDDRPNQGLARKTLARFKVFRDILNDPDELAEQGVEFRRWFIDKKVKDTRKETHVALNYGSFRIEPDEEALFLERYAVTLARGHTFYMVERPTPVFRLFFDFDFKNLGPLTGQGIEAVALVAGRAVARFFPNRDIDDASQNLRIIVCCTDIKKDTIESPSGKVNVHKTGVHMHWPNVILNGHQAMTIRESVLADLISTFGPRVPPQQNSWEDVSDASVFPRDGLEGSGLRMLGSRKAEKCPTCKGKPKLADGTWCKAKGCRGGRVDAGRPQHLFFATDGKLKRSQEQEVFYLQNLLKLIQDVSIRTSLKEDDVIEGQLGQVLPEGAPLQVPKKTKSIKATKGDAVGANTGGLTKSKEVPPGSLFEVLQNLIRESFAERQSDIVVTHVKQQIRDKSQLVNVTGTNAHFCQNIGREHKSNRIFFSVTIEGITQRCYDPSDILSDEMRFGLCKNYASSATVIPKKFRDLLWPKLEDDSATTNSLAVELQTTLSIRVATKSIVKQLLTQGDFLCQKLFGTTWSATLSFENNQKVLRDRSHNFMHMGADDLGIKARQALRQLGFQVDDLEDPLVPKRKVQFEVPLSELEDNLWTSFRNWVSFVAELDENELDEHFSKKAQPENPFKKNVKRRKIEIVE